MSTLVLGVGNPDRGDDAVGIRVVERLRERARQLQGEGPLDDVRLEILPGDTLALLDAWEGAERVLLVDAMRSGDEPGRVRRLDGRGEELGEALGSFVSSHAFSLSEAISLARSLGRLPEHLVIFGIEAEDFTPGAALSPAVAAALDSVVPRIEEECRCTKRP